MIDIWVSSRSNRAATWSMPLNVVALNTASEDIPRPPGQHSQVMPLASKPGGIAGVYQTFLATRSANGAPFGAPVLLSELAYADRSTVDGFLTDDGLTLFFSSSALLRPSATPARPSTAASRCRPRICSSAWRRTVDEAFRRSSRSTI